MGDSRKRAVAQASNDGNTTTPLARKRKHADPRMVQPGEVLCPVDDQPGMALIDDRGVKIYHPRQGRPPIMACRPVGHRFADLVVVGDQATLDAFEASPPDTICERCRHRQRDHVPPHLADTDDEDELAMRGCACGCPGPGGVIIE